MPHLNPANNANRDWSDYDKPYNEGAAHELNFLRKRKNKP